MPHDHSPGLRWQPEKPAGRGVAPAGRCPGRGVLIIVWVLLARMTHNDVGLAAWGVGGLLGIVIGQMAKPRPERLGGRPRF